MKVLANDVLALIAGGPGAGAGASVNIGPRNPGPGNTNPGAGDVADRRLEQLCRGASDNKQVSVTIERENQGGAIIEGVGTTTITVSGTCGDLRGPGG